MVKSILIVLMAAVLSACSSVSPITFTPTPVEKPQLVVPTVDKFNARAVQWIVVTPDNVNNVFKDLEDNNVDVVLFALTDEGYANLTLNMGETIRLLQQQKAIIAAYKQYYESQQ